MTLYCSVSSPAPATTHVIMGYYDNKNYYLDLTSATTIQKDTVADFLSVIGTHITVEVNNVPGDKMNEGTIIVPETTDLDVVTVDYLTLNQADKDKVNAYLTLLESLI